MRWFVFWTTASIAISLLSPFLVLSIIIGMAAGDGLQEILGLLITLLITLSFIPAAKRAGDSLGEVTNIRDLDAIIAVALTWPAVVLLGTLPYWLGPTFQGPLQADMLRGFAYAWFESMSGFTTTGATVIDATTSPSLCAVATLDCVAAQPKSILVWRSFSQWLGGMGIVMMSLLVLSKIMSGGHTMATSELTGPTLNRLAPRLYNTGIRLWAIYFGLTVAEFIALLSAGSMFGAPIDWFDALNLSLTTMPTGGFAPHDAGITVYNSAIVEGILILFMFLAGVNFTLLHLGLVRRKFRKATADKEFQTYVCILLVAAALMTLNLTRSGLGHSFGWALRHAVFQSVAIGTSTGYSSADFAMWPGLSGVIILTLMIIGSCAGSTGGGVKVLRMRILAKISGREISQLGEPRLVLSLKEDSRTVEQNTLNTMVGMLGCWVFIFIIGMIVIGLFDSGLSFESLISATASSMGNTGPALDQVGPTQTWSGLSIGTLFTTTILMWMGRLELLTVMVVLRLRNWRRSTSK